MAELPRPCGMPGWVALQRFLSIKSISFSPTGTENIPPEDLDLNAMARELRSAGLLARTVRVTSDNLRHLQLPSLLKSIDGGWIVVRQRTLRRYVVELETDRPQVLAVDALGALLAGPALDIGDPLPEVGSLWSRVLRTLPRYRKEILLAAGASVLLQCLALAVPLLTKLAFDYALPHRASDQLEVLALGLLLVGVFRAWVGWLKESALLSFATKFEAAIQIGFLQQLLSLPFRRLERKSLGQLMQPFWGISKARDQLMKDGMGALFGAATSIPCLIWMFLIMPGPAALVALVSAGGGVVAIGLGYWQAREQVREVESGQAQRGALAEMLRGIATLKATASQDWALRRWTRNLDGALEAGLRRERIDTFTLILQEVLGNGLSSGILIWGSVHVLNGRLSLGGLMAFVQLSSEFVGAFMALASTVVALIGLRPQLREVEDVLSSASTGPRCRRSSSEGLPGPVILEDVWFRYSDQSRWVVRNEQLEVKAHAFHHLKGPSGSGKSTLLKLVAGLYEPEKGRISIGGIKPSAAFGLIMYLPQFPQLMSGSILDNLKLFSGGADFRHLTQVAEDTGLAEWVKALPMGYQTVLASGGANLSGGQRQLLAITALLASDKHLLLMDEAMSNLDWVSRERVLHSRHFTGRTVIYASHEEVLPTKEAL